MAKSSFQLSRSILGSISFCWISWVSYRWKFSAFKIETLTFYLQHVVLASPYVVPLSTGVHKPEIGAFIILSSFWPPHLNPVDSVSTMPNNSPCLPPSPLPAPCLWPSVTLFQESLLGLFIIASASVQFLKHRADHVLPLLTLFSDSPLPS